jgi:ABC-2 type transport system ATP-binding protein
VDAGAVSKTADDPVPVLRDLTIWAGERGVGLPDLQVRRPSLEDVYLELTRHDGAGEGA